MTTSVSGNGCTEPVRMADLLDQQDKESLLLIQRFEESRVARARAELQIAEGGLALVTEALERKESEG